jgi:hypothetical protein
VTLVSLILHVNALVLRVVKEKVGQKAGSISKTAPDADENFRPLRIVGSESQKAAIVGDRVRDTGEADGVNFTLFNFLYFVVEPFFEVELNRFNSERFVEFRLDVNGFGNPFPTRSPQDDIPGRQVNRCLNKGFNLYVFKRMPWVIGVDFDGFAQFAIIASRFELYCDFALPARGNCPIVIGNGTASAGANLFDLERLVARV